MFAFQAIFVVFLALSTVFQRDDVRDLAFIRPLRALADRPRILGAGQVALLAALHISTLPYPDPPPETERFVITSQQQCLLQHQLLGWSVACELDDIDMVYEGHSIIRHTCSVLPTPLPYFTVTDLAIYDSRRELAVYRKKSPRAPVMCGWPRDLDLYTGTIADVPDLDAYDIITYVYRPRFQDATHLFETHAHLDGESSFMRWSVDVADDTIGRMVARSKRSGSGPTIGEFRRQPEERAICALILLHCVGLLISMILLAKEELLGWRQLFDQQQYSVSLPETDLDNLIQDASNHGPMTTAEVPDWWKHDATTTKTAPKAHTSTDFTTSSYSYSTAFNDPQAMGSFSSPALACASIRPMPNPQNIDPTQHHPCPEREPNRSRGTPAYKVVGWRRRIAD